VSQMQGMTATEAAATTGAPSPLGQLLAKDRTTINIIGGALVPSEFEGVQRLASWVMNTGMVPKGVTTLAQATLLLAAGMEIGLPPIASLKGLMIVNNRPAVWGDAALGLVRRSPLCVSVDEKLSADKSVATCTSVRRGQSEPITRSFSVADAKRAGLWGKAGPWTQYPERMLQMRARAFSIRDAFPDVLGGLGIVEEEQDIPAKVEPVEPRARAFSIRDAFPDVLGGLGIVEEEQDIPAKVEPTTAQVRQDVSQAIDAIPEAEPTPAAPTDPIASLPEAPADEVAELAREMDEDKAAAQGTDKAPFDPSDIVSEMDALRAKAGSQGSLLPNPGPTNKPQPTRRK